MSDSQIIRTEPPKRISAIHASLRGICPMLAVDTEKLEVVILFTNRDAPFHPMNASLTIRDAKLLHKFLGETFMDIAANQPEELNDAG